VKHRTRLALIWTFLSIELEMIIGVVFPKTGESSP
jgi:hypothetical protein